MSEALVFEDKESADHACRQAEQWYKLSKQKTGVGDLTKVRDIRKHLDSRSSICIQKNDSLGLIKIQAGIVHLEEGCEIILKREFSRLTRLIRVNWEKPQSRVKKTLVRRTQQMKGLLDSLADLLPKEQLKIWRGRLHLVRRAIWDTEVNLKEV